MQEKMYKIRMTDLDELKQRLRKSGPSWITSSLRQPFSSGVVDTSSSVMIVLYTFSCNILHMLMIMVMTFCVMHIRSCVRLGGCLHV